MAQRREQQLRPETPTRALLRRVQRRSSAGGAPPPLPTKRYVSSKLDQVAEGSRSNTGAEAFMSQETEDMSEEQEDMEALMTQIDQMHEDIDSKDARIAELEAQLRDATSSRSNTTASNGVGLTRAAALKLEREFASQERILQGLQRDNEAKTIEVEKLRREKKIMADHLARQYGAEDWERIVFNSSSIGKSGMVDTNGETDDITPSKHTMNFASPFKTLKGPLGRLGKTSEGVAESSFFSADESIAVGEPPQTSSSPSPIPGTSSVDLAAILSLIESQKMLIKGFERSNALRMVECQEKIRIATEKEELWRGRLAQHQQRT